MSNHTPGPWKIEMNVRGGGCNHLAITARHAGDDWMPCSVSRMDLVQDIDWANAKLIAAAPDLLEACKLFLDMWHRAGPLGSRQFEKFDAVVRKCSMAVDRATP